MGEIERRRILIVDDDLAIRLTLKELLAKAGYDAKSAASGEEALDLATEEPFDLALIDLIMPGIDGLELMKRLREILPQMVTIVLTAYGSMDSAVEALRLGAHDYLTKPCDLEALRSCVEEGLKKGEKAGVPTRGRLVVGDLEVDLDRHIATLASRELSLTPMEFDILAHLAKDPSRVFTSKELVREVQGYDCDEAEAREIVRWHIHGLRKKMGTDAYIKTVWGVGYRLVDPNV